MDTIKKAERSLDIMLVDDSRVMRSYLKRILSKAFDRVTFHEFQNGQEACVDRVNSFQPDIIFLDVEMPVMDGLEALPKLKNNYPKTPIVMCSALTTKAAKITLQALRDGASEFIAKPSGQMEASVIAFEEDVIRKVESLCVLQERKTEILAQNCAAKLYRHSVEPHAIAIASSTGGPTALETVLMSLASCPVPIFITQHMPPTFTRILAEQLTKKTGRKSYEAEDGMSVDAHSTYIARGAMHMGVRAHNTEIKLRDIEAPPKHFCKPAADMMLPDLIKIYDKNLLLIVLTGMGCDGSEGAKALFEKGGRVIIQDKETSVVWGMPGTVAEAGTYSSMLALDDIGPTILKAFKRQESCA